MTTTTNPFATWTWHATSTDTAGQYALAEVVVRPGDEPPPHVHAREDEAFHVLSGEIAFTRGIERIGAGPGSHVFLPRGIPHTFSVESDEARVLVLCTPGGLEEAFLTGAPQAFAARGVEFLVPA